MRYRTRDGRTVCGNEGQERFLALLYGTAVGRAAVKVLVNPAVSRVGGAFLDSPLSRWMVKPFVKRNRIDLTQYQEEAYDSYNAFFTRTMREGLRPVDEEPLHLISPCDGKLTAYPITAEGSFCIKQTRYTVKELLRSERLAGRYYGGTALVFRLTVDDYHHYCYVDQGEKSRNYRIPGVLHTVNPIANDVYPIYKENAREYSLLRSRNFRTVLMMEVGALMVGRIVNRQEEALVRRGEEKGFFAFGGSTVVLLMEPGAVRVDEDIWRNSRAGVETVVRMGEKVGCAGGRSGASGNGVSGGRSGVSESRTPGGCGENVREEGEQNGLSGSSF
ncbi:MAG: phosphatidylserine decarboxylase [Eubacteriales bacterium]|nr:phosphatidylserine decarboxylase [Eubacteriales bacterium]